MSKISLTVDRFEGDGKTIAVLLTDDDQTINFLRSLLPKGTKAGDVLTFAVEKDSKATAAVSEKTSKIQAELAQSDDGGDLKL